MKTEHQTRQDTIDLALEKSGWSLKAPAFVLPELIS